MASAVGGRTPGRAYLLLEGALKIKILGAEYYVTTSQIRYSLKSTRGAVVRAVLRT